MTISNVALASCVKTLAIEVRALADKISRDMNSCPREYMEDVRMLSDVCAKCNAIETMMELVATKIE